MRTALAIVHGGDRDALAALSTAVTSVEPFHRMPALAEAPPAGWFEEVDGRGVFVRRTTSAPQDPAGARPDAWYIHGLAGSSTNWTSIAGALHELATGYTVDLPGHGRSDPPPRGRYRLDADADVVAALINRHSTGPVHLVANSMGGVVATSLAARFPELVSTLTLISPAVPDLRLTRDRGADVRLAVLLAPGTTNMALRRLSALSPLERARGMGELCFGNPGIITESDYLVAAEDLAWRTGLPWVHRATIESLRALMSSHLRRRRGSFAADAHRVRVPTLLIWGTRDRLVDARLAPRTLAAFADSSLLMLPGVGHTAQMEDPARTAGAIRSLWERAGAPPRKPGNHMTLSSM